MPFFLRDAVAENGLVDVRGDSGANQALELDPTVTRAARDRWGGMSVFGRSRVMTGAVLAAMTVVGVASAAQAADQPQPVHVYTDTSEGVVIADNQAVIPLAAQYYAIGAAG
ncbi:hypothetical protein [Streptomyces sp. RLB1-9]|uniref:hypothetical protein n=1 Tax=Streptomyces sp. RLB1-9 TaxID=2594454 RepID=UPI0019687313|nr:hypothetical protein [Streptomyces sp. RLB1-9]